ncbi:MAG: hypothetical protein ACFFD4_14195 [Candidatus Odinarchaeota archaeon]
MSPFIKPCNTDNGFLVAIFLLEPDPATCGKIMEGTLLSGLLLTIYLSVY